MSAACTLLVSRLVWGEHADRLLAIAARHGVRLIPRLADGPHGADGLPTGVEIAFFSRDLYTGSTMERAGESSVQFFAAALASPVLRWVQLCSSGLDLPDYRALLSRPGLTLSTGAGTTARPIAMNVLAAVLGLQRGFGHWLNAQQEGRWAPFARDALPRDTDGLTAVVVGAGAIGTEVARLLRAIGMTTIGVRASGAAHPDFDHVVQQAQLADVLPSCNWLVLACPLTAQTHRMIAAPQLALLPPGAGLVNVGRGGLIDEPDLIKALAVGRPGHAYLDVFATEPLPADSPLWYLPNVWITPHNASASAGHDARLVGIFADNLDRWLTGRELINAVSVRIREAAGEPAAT
ncbi:D-2-hydroxyacid dehydrogenase [Paraburkholderia xenovorans]|uniref:D-2-hydroxyacid dehydrogenase n=1 Tax=Paraburkholderia xenovorans TaxID=36873 RepID=UPI0015C548E0|nr:D-2-hydroxyacid dehydrogenase [Paraburkholderia xenovorans]NPT35691.1 D-2-hydroxyacid dehydrogenase [Paraburkholderia xenovorans]